MNRILGLTVMLVGLSGTAMAQAEQAALLAGSCQGCHGVTGAGALGIPAIYRTMTRTEFTTAMQDFRAGRREATVMGRIARGYSDAEFSALAVIYARPEASR